MKDAARRPVLVSSMVLYAALTAASTGAWADEEPVVPFPGPSVSGMSVPGSVEDGEGRSAEALLPSGAASASVAAGPGVPSAAAGDETTEPDAGAEVPSPSGPAGGAESSDAAAPDGAMAPARVSAVEPATPAGGSRLLRALAELPPTPGAAHGDVPGEAARPGTPQVFGTSVPGTSVSGASVFAAEGCPRALLRRLLAGAAGEADALSALGIEREILSLCRERQEILAGLFETEARLSELSEAGRPPQTPVMAASVAPAPREGVPGEAPPAGTSAPSPLRAALGGAAETRVPETLVPETPDTPSGNTRAAEPQVSARVSPRYAWFSIIGTAGALRAGVTDGSGVWFVREGDALPGGARVTAIVGRPPAVQLKVPGETLVSGTDEQRPLPYRSRPGGGP